MKITDEYVFFWGDDDIYSNFYITPTPMVIGGKTIMFRSSEHAFMYIKALYFCDLKSADLIIKTSHPYDAKKIGRKVKNFNDILWSAISMTVMYDVNLAKFSHTEILRQCLLETGDRIIVEASPYDKIWGIGLAENDPKALDQSNWKGKNNLGKVLMQLRETLKNR